MSGAELAAIRRQLAAAQAELTQADYYAADWQAESAIRAARARIRAAITGVEALQTDERAGAA